MKLKKENLVNIYFIIVVHLLSFQSQTIPAFFVVSPIDALTDVLANTIFGFIAYVSNSTIFLSNKYFRNTAQHFNKFFRNFYHDLPIFVQAIMSIFLVTFHVIFKKLVPDLLHFLFPIFHIFYRSILSYKAKISQKRHIFVSTLLYRCNYL